MEMVTAYDA